MMNFKNWNKNFPLYIPSGENRNTFSEALLLREIFRWNNPKTLSCFIYFLKGIFRNALQMANQPWLRLGKGSYFKGLYYYMRNFCSLIGLEQWYFSLIWNTKCQISLQIMLLPILISLAKPETSSLNLYYRTFYYRAKWYRVKTSLFLKYNLVYMRGFTVISKPFEARIAIKCLKSNHTDTFTLFETAKLGFKLLRCSLLLF